MKTVTLQIDESTDAQLAALAQRCDATPGQFIDMLCAALDRNTLERVILQSIGEAGPTVEPGVAQLPERPAKSDLPDMNLMSRTESTPS